MTTDLAPQIVNIDETVELVSKGFEVQLPRTLIFRTASRADRMNYMIGLYQADGTPTDLVKIINAPVSEYSIADQAGIKRTTIRGRDAVALALDRIFRKNWLAVAPPPPDPAAPPSTEPPDPWPPTETVIGLPTARQVAAEALVFANEGLADDEKLVLDWQVPNYQLRQDYSAAKRVIDVIRDMAAPFQQVAPFQARIIGQGLMLRVVPQYPTGLAPTPTRTMTAAEARRAGLTVRKRPMQKIGRVTLTGVSSESAAGEDQGVRTVTYESRTTDQFGIVTKTITTETRRYPNTNIMEQMVKDFYVRQLKLVGVGQMGPVLSYLMQEETLFTYEDSEQDQKLPNPLLLKKVMNTWGFIERAGAAGTNRTWVCGKISETLYDYDPETRYMRQEMTTDRELDFGAMQMENRTQTIRTMHQIDELFTLDVRDTSYWDITNKQWQQGTHDESAGAGHLPGGPGRGDAGGLPSQAIIRKLWINHDADAVDFSYSNQAVDETVLDLIAAWLTAADLLWEWELMLDGVLSPNYEELDYLKITDYRDADGNEIKLPVFVITEIRATHNETSRPINSRLSVRGFGYTATGVIP